MAESTAVKLGPEQNEEPDDSQREAGFAAAGMAGSKNTAAGKALIDSLRSPEAAALFRAKGLDPR